MRRSTRRGAAHEAGGRCLTAPLQNNDKLDGIMNLHLTVSFFLPHRRLAGVLSMALLAFAAPPAYSEYPERVIRAIVPFAPGGTNDLMARLISPHLGKIVGQSVVVENRPGAAGNVGIEMVAKAAPDGYTLIYSATASTQNPALFRNLRFDPINDIQPVASIADFPYAITVHRQLPVKTAMGLLDQLRNIGFNFRSRDTLPLLQWLRGSILGWRRRGVWDAEGTEALHKLGFVDIYELNERVVQSEALPECFLAPALVARTFEETPTQRRNYGIGYSPKQATVAWVHGAHDELLKPPSIPELESAIRSFLTAV